MFPDTLAQTEAELVNRLNLKKLRTKLFGTADEAFWICKRLDQVAVAILSTSS
jgi:hypothetical protein